VDVVDLRVAEHYSPGMPPIHVHRRALFLLASGAVLGSCRATRPTSGMTGVTGRSGMTGLGETLARLERGGRLGVAVLDTATGAVEGHRLDERFAMCSTFKLVLAAQVLQRARRGGPALASTVELTERDLLSHAPVTRALVDAAAARGERAATASLVTLAHAAQTTSDNTAANLLLRHLGGLAEFTAYCRANGDDVTRLDRYEPEMNDVQPGDVRDTTSPRAMAGLVARLFGEAGLAREDRATLRSWMIETETGAARVRAGLPAGWVAGDKTGTGGGTCTVKVNDVVWIEPPGRAPLVVAAYYDTATPGEWPSDAQEAVLADVGRAVAGA